MCISAPVRLDQNKCRRSRELGTRNMRSTALRSWPNTHSFSLDGSTFTTFTTRDGQELAADGGSQCLMPTANDVTSGCHLQPTSTLIDRDQHVFLVEVLSCPLDHGIAHSIKMMVHGLEYLYCLLESQLKQFSVISAHLGASSLTRTRRPDREAAAGPSPLPFPILQDC